MGDRGQVFINGVYLYTHWGASDLISQVKKAIAKHWRWDDHEYLTRIIFDEMLTEQHGTETGFGIGIDIHDDIWRLITITSNNKIIIKERGVQVFEGTFEEFLKSTFEQE